MTLKPSSLLMFAKMSSKLAAMRSGRFTRVLILFPVCFLLTACGLLSHTFRSPDCDIIQKTEGGSSVVWRAVVSGIVGKGELTKGTGWFVREPGPQGRYFIRFDPPFSAVPTCCVEAQQPSLSKLSVDVAPSPSGLRLEATHGSERCLRKENKIEYGYVVDERCAEWQTFQVPWGGRLKFSCISR